MIYAKWRCVGSAGELGVHPQRQPESSHAASDDVAYTKVSTDAPYVFRLATIRVGSGARDDEGAWNVRQRRGQIVSDAR